MNKFIEKNVKNYFFFKWKKECFLNQKKKKFLKKIVLGFEAKIIKFYYRKWIAYNNKKRILLYRYIVSGKTFTILTFIVQKNLFKLLKDSFSSVQIHAK